MPTATSTPVAGELEMTEPLGTSGSAASVAAPGVSWAWTRAVIAAAWVRFRRSGTATSALPVTTVTETVDPLSTSALAGGSCSVTVPSAWSLLVTNFVGETTSPWAVARVWACSRVWPT